MLHDVRVGNLRTQHSNTAHTTQAQVVIDDGTHTGRDTDETRTTTRQAATIEAAAAGRQQAAGSRQQAQHTASASYEA